MEAKYKVGDKVIVKTKCDINPKTGKFYQSEDYLYAFPKHMIDKSANIIWNISKVSSPCLSVKIKFPGKSIYGDCAKYCLQGSNYSYHSGMFENGR